MSNVPKVPTPTTEAAALEGLTSQELGTLGVEEIAYVKPVVVNGTYAYAIHAADGQHLALVPNRDIAFATVRDNELEPASVH